MFGRATITLGIGPHFFVCFLYGYGFLSGGKRYRGVKFCTRVGLLSGQVFSSFGEDWLARSHGGGGITSDQCPLPFKNLPG